MCSITRAIVPPTEGGPCVVTGGDDNGLTVSHLRVDVTSAALDLQYSHPNAHSSSITGTLLL